MLAWPAMLPDLPPPPIEVWPLPYEVRLDSRALDSIEGVVIHCTETPDLARARSIGEREVHPSGTGNSGHYYIDLDGRVFRFVDDRRVAHHVRGFNAQSIGIELVNRGRFPRWFDSDHQAMQAPYPAPQIDALIGLLQQLRAELPNLRWIAGHEDLDTEQVAASDDPQQTVARKRDPGPQFPWPRVLQAVDLERLPARPPAADR
jgi:N-acetylmuramoyl-L-alanine amidase